MRGKQTERRFVLCVKNDDCDDLEKRKVYRVIDESGDDYLYPASYFVKLELPHEAELAIAAAG